MPATTHQATTMRARVRDSYGSPGLLRLDLVTGLPYAIRLAGFGLLRPRVHVPGSDVAGTVAAVGQNGTRFRPGDEVFGTCAGSFAEYASAHRTTSRQARERHVRAGCRTHLRVCCPAGPPGHRKGGGGAEGPGHRRRRGRGDIRGATGQGIRSPGRGRVQHGQGQGRRSRAGPASRLHALTPPAHSEHVACSSSRRGTGRTGCSTVRAMLGLGRPRHARAADIAAHHRD